MKTPAAIIWWGLTITGLAHYKNKRCLNRALAAEPHFVHGSKASGKKEKPRLSFNPFSIFA
jgi:hypothetical protein